MTQRHPHLKLYILLILAMMIWGLSWTNAKILGTYTDPQVIMFWRFLFSGLSFIPVMYFFKQSPKLSQRGFISVLAGAVMITAYNYLYFQGTQIGPAGVGGVLVTTMNPLITLLLSVILFKVPMQKKDTFGLALGLFGGLLILKVWTFSPDQVGVSANTHFLLASAAWAVVTLITNRSKDEIPVLAFSFWVFNLATLLSFIFAKEYQLMEIFSFDWIFWLNFILVSIFSMAFATTVYFLAAMRLGSGKAASFIFTVPVSAMGFSMLFLGEKLEITTAIGGVAAIAAVYLINKK